LRVVRSRDPQQLRDRRREVDGLHTRDLVGIEELPAVLDRFLPYGETTTSIVNTSPIPRRDPPPLDEDA
jgi:hypothetical protein